MLYDPKWNKDWEDHNPGVPLRNRPLLWLMVALPWAVLFGMIGMTMSTVAELSTVKVHSRHIGR